MNLQRLVDHLGEHHKLCFEDIHEDPVEEWMAADRLWQIRLVNDPPNPLPCNYNSEKGKRYSEDESQNEEEIDEAKVTPFDLPQQEVLTWIALRTSHVRHHTLVKGTQRRRKKGIMRWRI